MNMALINWISSTRNYLYAASHERHNAAAQNGNLPIFGWTRYDQGVKLVEIRFDGALSVTGSNHQCHKLRIRPKLLPTIRITKKCTSGDKKTHTLRPEFVWVNAIRNLCFPGG